MFLIKFVILLQIFYIKQTKCIINNNLDNSYNQLKAVNYKTLQTGTFYLNRQNPLWILQDSKPKELQNIEKSYHNPRDDHIKPIYYRNTVRPNVPQNHRFETKAQNRITIYNNNNKEHLKLPKNYISSFKPKSISYVPPFKKLPSFDNMPGDESYDGSKPLFIYTGQKGRMLFNTMLSNYKYRMQEPVPGQTLYPPQTLIMATPKARDMFTSSAPLNVTMIPFYAYEAIDPRMRNNQVYHEFNKQPIPSQSLTLIPRTPKPKRHKKSKKYSAFYSPQEVLAQNQYDSTTSLPLTLEKPYANHKIEKLEATTSLPHKRLEVTYNDGEDKFRITYEDEESSANLERPTEVTTAQSSIYDTRVSPSSYYTVPQYSVGNQDTNEVEFKSESRKGNRETQEDVVTKDTAQDIDDSENTWFILNARYKGPLKSNLKNLHSSKYVQTTRKAQDDLDFLKTTTISAAKKKKLRPQMRAMYGDNLEIVL